MVQEIVKKQNATNTKCNVDFIVILHPTSPFWLRKLAPRGFPIASKGWFGVSFLRCSHQCLREFLRQFLQRLEIWSLKHGVFLGCLEVRSIRVNPEGDVVVLYVAHNVSLGFTGDLPIDDSPSSACER